MVEIGKDIAKAAKLLASGEVVAIPTETVYGLAANALNETAAAKIFSVKNRPPRNPLIIHIADTGDLAKYVKNIPPIAEDLMAKFWPGPLTMLLPKKDIISDIITASLPQVAVRIPDHPLTLKLLNEIDFPVAAPSANPFGYISPTNPAHVQQQIGDKIPYILDGGPCMRGVESTIVGFEGDAVVVYRLGAITLEELEDAAGKVKLHSRVSDQPKAPGMLPYHYSPKTPFFVTDDVEKLLKKSSPENIGVIVFSYLNLDIPQDHLEILSPAGDIREAARNLYGAFHRLDALGLKAIIAERFPDEGLGKTINDRLEKAAGKHKQL